MPATKYFLDSDGLKFFAQQLVDKIGLEIGKKMVTTVDGTSVNTAIPGAKAVYDAIQAALASANGVSFETVEGAISTVTTPSASTIYLQKDDAADTTWTMYVYVNSTWIDIGSTDVDLTNYWAKSDLTQIQNANIQAILDEVFGVTPPAP